MGERGLLKPRAFDAESRSIDELLRELEQLDAEIRQARSREVGPVMDRILKTMADWSISLAELERYRRTQDRRASDTGRGRIPSAAWSPRVPAQTRGRVQRALDEMPGLDETYAPDYRERVWAVVLDVARAWGGQYRSTQYEGSKVTARVRMRRRTPFPAVHRGAEARRLVSGLLPRASGANVKSGVWAA